jgi:hypothetical protein
MKNAYWPLSVAIEAGPLICSVAFAVLVGSVADVAVIVTLPPVGGVEGAVYTVAAPLAVATGLNEPQDPMGVVQLQFTGVVAGSLTVVATIDTVVAISSAPGGGVVRVIAITGGVIDTVWLLNFVLSVTDVAVIVTLPPAGIVAGAVYTVLVPLAVLDRLNNPHPLGMQLQVTPAPAESFVTTAEMLAVPDIGRLAGGTAPKSTEIGKVTAPAANLVLSETEVAVMVTLPPVGAVAGAV